LQWIDDESNNNINFTRNFLRHEILPILKKRWPTVTNTLSRVAGNCQEAQAIIETIAKQDTLSVKGSLPNTLSITKLVLLDPLRQRQVLRVWLKQLGFSLPSVIKMREIQQHLLQAKPKPDKLPTVSFGNVELRRFREELHASECARK
jgi:tRNA(Ile)-lysidine synthase